MKQVCRILLFTFVIHSSSFNILYSQQAPLVKQWDKAYGGGGSERLYKIQPTTDGGYILGGYSTSGVGGEKSEPSRGGSSRGDYWVVKLDSAGKKQWDKTFGGAGNESFSTVEQTRDGGYIIGGYTESGATGDISQPSWDNTAFIYDYWVVKTDSAGNKQWDKRFGGVGSDYLYDLRQTCDGGYILGGGSQSGKSGDKSENSRGGTDYWIIKIDSAGTKQWDHRYGSPGQDYFYSMDLASDGGYILAGESFYGAGGDKSESLWGSMDYWLVKIDSAGIKQWDKRFGGTGDDWLPIVKRTPDGGYIVANTSSSPVSGDKTAPLLDVNPVWGAEDFWVVKIDANGIKQWDKNYGGTNTEDMFGSVFITSDNGFLFAGSSFSNISGDKTDNNLGTEQSWIVKTDSAGNKQWDKVLHTYSGSGQDENGFAIQTKDGYLMGNYTPTGIGGDKTQGSRGSWDYWIVKFKDTTAGFVGKDLPKPVKSCLSCNALPGIVTALHDTVCPDQPPVLSVTGIPGFLQWQYSINGANFTDLPGLTSPVCLDIPTQTAFYRVIGYGDCPSTSEAHKIVVNPAPHADYTTNVSGVDVTFNSGGSSTDITKYDWDFGDGAHSDLPNPVHTYTHTDSFLVCLTAYNKFNCPYQVCHKIGVDVTTEASGLTSQNDLIIYPNPFSMNNVQLSVTNNLVGSKLEVYDGEGRLVFNSKLETQYSKLQLDVWRGVYFLRISSSKVNIIRKLIRL